MASQPLHERTRANDHATSPLFTLQDGFVYQAESGEPKGLMKYPENKTK